MSVSTETSETMNMTQSARYNLNLPSIDDEMEMATSPYRQADDIDIDLDPMHDSTNKSLLDEADHANDDLDPMQADTEITYQDDDMIDDEGYDDQTYNSINQDLNMEAYNEINVDGPDEDIMFDEEIEATTIQYEHTDDHDSSNIAMPLDQDQDRDQAQVGSTNMTMEAHAEPAPNEDQQQANSDTQIHDDYNISNIEAINLPDVPHLQYETNKEQIQSESEDVPETYATNIVTDESGDISRDSVPADHEQSSSIDVANGTNDATEQKLDESQPLALQNLEQPQNNDSNPTQAVESEQPDHPAIGEPQPNDDDEAPTNEVLSDLHSVMVTYLGQEMSLFPPSFGDTSVTFFLADPTLAYDSFEKLLVACRSLLGESLEHDDELVLDIPTLGLHISEDSKYASELGLAQVLDVYLTLSRNERVESPEPLYCHLSSRVCLSSQYTYLATSAREGKCYSDIAADYAESPEDPEEDAETYDEVSEHQQEENDEDKFAEENIDPEHKTDEDVSTMRPEAQEESVATGLYVTTTEEAVTQSPHIEVGINAATSVDSTERPQLDGVEAPSPGANEPFEEHPKQSEVVSPNGQRLQSPSDEQEDFATNNEDEDEEQIEQTAQTPITEQNEEAQTPSSHTVQADYAGSQHDLDEEQASQDQTQTDGDYAKTTQAVDDYTQDDIDYSDEELFGDDDPAEAATNALRKEDSPEIEEDLFAPQPNGRIVQDDATTAPVITNENKPNITSIDGVDQVVSPVKSSNDSRDKVDDFLNLDEGPVSVPVTPSKMNGNKRKALDDDDELVFLDVDTPEPKRRRPS